MPTTFWENIAETPWWFWVVFTYLFYLSTLATKPRIVPMKALFLAPGIMLVVYFAGLCYILPLNLINIFYLLTGFTAGTLLGWLQFRYMRVTAVQGQQSLALPGSWLLFFIVLGLFYARWRYQSFLLTLDPHVLLTGIYSHYFFAFFGLGIGLYTGRLIYSLRQFRQLI